MTAPAQDIQFSPPAGVASPAQPAGRQTLLESIFAEIPRNGRERPASTEPAISSNAWSTAHRNSERAADDRQSENRHGAGTRAVPSTPLLDRIRAESDVAHDPGSDMPRHQAAWQQFVRDSGGA